MISKRNKDSLINQLIFTGPTIFIFSSVVLLAFAFGIYLTFTNWDGLSSTMTFAGIKNYAAVITDSKFWTSLGLTVKYVFFTVVIANAMAFFLAYALTTKMKGRNIARAGFFIPNLIGGIIMGVLWRMIFTYILVPIGDQMHWGIFQSSWVNDEKYAIWALITVSVWQSMGYLMIIYVAGFMSVPKDLIEASAVDGADGFVKMKKIIMPLMVPSFVICLFISTKGGFMVYDVNRALTDGGPYKSSELISYHIYQTAFMHQDFGKGQAEALVLFLIVVAVTLTQTYLMKKMEVEM